MTRRKRFTRNLGRNLKTPLPVRSTVQWIRFEHEHEPNGLFSFADDALETLPPVERDELNALLRWFADHLKAPDLLTVERFWFRAEATVHVSQARRLAALLNEAAIPIVERRTSRIPGKVKWEDKDQIAVLTYRDTPQGRKK